MALTHLLDTSVYCQPLRRIPLPEVERRWRMLGDERLAISAICEAELLHGLEAKNSPRLWIAYRAILKGRLRLLTVDRRVAGAYGKLAARAQRQGRPRPPFDLLIAATAQAHGLTVATLNVAHFDGIEGLRVEDWNNRA
jgi:tRNA(fMet)-specific endonuclease VapC